MIGNMNYASNLKLLRQQMLQSATGREAPQNSGLESFVPARVQAATLQEDTEDLISRSANWLSDIKKASIEFRKQYEELKSKEEKRSEVGALVNGALGELTRPKARPEEMADIVSEAKAQPLIERRGERPSRFAPENVAWQPSQKFSGKESFVEALYPKAIEIGKQIGVDPRLIMAQAALETGWGKSVASNNFFGIKATGEEPSVELATKEEINGELVGVRDRFRAYSDPEESFEDYANFLATNDRYLPLLAAKGLDAQLEALGKSGYATDSQYVKKLRSIINNLPDPRNYTL